MLPLRVARTAPLPLRQFASTFCAVRATGHARGRPCSTSARTTAKLPPDHRDLGTKQGLFATSIYSPGSPIFLPHGTRIFNRLVDFLRKQYVHYGFEEVITPTMYKKALWAKSGHLENYADDMFTVTSTTQAREDDAENEYGLKPMNCPGHCLIFAAQRRSYRDLPLRYADFSPLHRNENSGSLSGLTRVRRFHQDDGHIFCAPSQIEEEIMSTLDFVKRTYDILNLGSYRLVLSTRPLDNFIGTLEDWDQAENSLKKALDRSGQSWTLNAGDGAFYGPKIDIVLQDSDGKEHQTATIQLDFQLPKRFELEYQAPGSAAEGGGATTSDVALQPEAEIFRPVLIHRAILGSVERLMALLIEHYDGKWPFWLNPRQVMILTVNDSEEVTDFARQTRDILQGKKGPDDPHLNPSQLAVSLDESPRTIPLKVREAKSKGYGVIVVIGPKEAGTGFVTADLTGIPSVQIGKSGTKAKNLERVKPDDLLQRLHAMIESYN